MLQEIYFHFNEKLKDLGKVYIAGGAVRDHLLSRVPQDYDIFVLLNGSKYHSAQTSWEALLGMLKPYKILKKQTNEDVKKYGNHTLICTIEFKGVRVQIIGRWYMTIDTLMADFDYNICQFSYSEDGFYNLERIEAVFPHQDLKLIKPNKFPISTLRRGYMFAERYGVKFKDSDVIKLCKIIAEKEGNKTVDTGKGWSTGHTWKVETPF